MNRSCLMKFARLAVISVVVVSAAGCGGINSGVGVSPASFLLPGLMMNEPKPMSPDATTLGETNSVVVAQRS